MSEDKLLIAVNELISAYEQKATESIGSEQENALNVIEYGTVCNIGTVVRGLAIGDFISFQEDIEEIKNIEKRLEVEEYSDCKTAEVNSSIKVDKSPIRTDVENGEPVLKGGAVLKIPKASLKLENLKDKEFVKEYIDKNILEKYDFDGCLNCDLKSIIGFDIFQNVSFDIEPIFRISELLKSIKAALAEIEASLNPSPLLKNICDFADLWKGKLCPSLIARVSLFFPILIDKNIRGLIDIGFNIGGLLGIIISPILSIGATIGENLRIFFIKIADCILGAIRSIRDLALTVEQSIQNIYTSINNSATVFQNIGNTSISSDISKTAIYQSIFGNSAEKLKEEKKAKEEKPASKEASATAKSTAKTKEEISFSEKIKETSYSWNKSLNNVFSDTSLFKIASEQKKQSAIASQLPSLVSVINILNTLIKVVEDGKAEVLSVIDAIIYGLKAFTVFIQEPIFAKIKLIAELKFLFNLIRLVKIIKALFKNGFDCSNTEVPSEIIDTLEEANVDIDELLNSSIKNKRALGVGLLGAYKTEVDSYDCENSERARFEKEIDSIYNIIEKNF
jgi:hypothetical protein